MATKAPSKTLSQALSYEQTNKKKTQTHAVPHNPYLKLANKKYIRA